MRCSTLRGTFCSLITLATPRQDWTGSNTSRREGGGCDFTLSRSHSCCAVWLVYIQISPSHIWTTLYENTDLKNYRTQTENKTLIEHKWKAAKKNAKINEPVRPASVFRDLSQLCSFTTRVLWAVTSEQQQRGKRYFIQERATVSLQIRKHEAQNVCELLWYPLNFASVHS